MPRVLTIAIVAGLIAGLLVGGFHNLFTVPVENRAIDLEEERAAVEATAARGEEDDGPTVPEWVQGRIGLPIGLALLGAIFGLLFAGGFHLLRRVVPEWKPLAIAVAVGALGFWTFALFPFVKYPVNPPGVGDPDTLLARQLYQTLFFLLSGLSMVFLLIAFQRIRSVASSATQQMKLYAAALAGYAVFALIIVFAIPGNPDPVPVPIDLLELFRALSMVGHFLHWALLALGVGLAIMWYERAAQMEASGQAHRSAPERNPAS